MIPSIVLATLELVSAAAQDQPAPAKPKIVLIPANPGETFKEQCARFATSSNYTFDWTVESDAPIPAGGTRDNLSYSGKVEVGKTSELKLGDLVAYRVGAKVVSKYKTTWETFEAKPAADKNDQTTLTPALFESRERFAMRRLATVPLPHEFLARLGRSVTNAKFLPDPGMETISAALTKDLADELSGARETVPSPTEKSSGGKKLSPSPWTTSSATATIFVTGNTGKLERVVIETVATSEKTTIKRKVTITIRDTGTTTVTVPEEATARLAK